jgi:glycosyltransferase involved in cell wall biosynthesis
MALTDGMAGPLVSVVIPTFERPAYLRIALASALAQTYRNLEIIVCDNASTTDPSEIVASFGDGRVRLHRHPRNIGQTPNIITGVARATGAFIAILGDDDVWRPDFIATLIAPMLADSDIVVAFCGHDIIDGEGKVDAALTEQVTRRFGRHLLRRGVYRTFYDIALVYRSICVVSGALIRRAAIDWSRIPLELPISVDIFIAYLLATSGGSCAYFPERLMQFRYHSLARPNAFTNVQRSWRADLRCSLELWLTFFRDERVTCRSYVKMICTRKAVLILLDRLQRGDWRGIGADIAQFLRWGLLDPRAIFYHLLYFQRFQLQGMRRYLP